jgi:hypothetical protein
MPSPKNLTRILILAISLVTNYNPELDIDNGDWSGQIALAATPSIDGYSSIAQNCAQHLIYFHANPGLAIVDSSGVIDLTWTAPGDDADSGRADYYVMKYSNNPLDESNWNLAFVAQNLPDPLDAGSPQLYTLGSLECGRRYFIAIKTYDDYGNGSPISNIANVFASGIMPPILVGAQIDTAQNSAGLFAEPIEAAMPVYYEFEIDTLLSFATAINDIDLTADSLVSVLFTQLLDDVTYFWRCRAVASDNSDSSVWSWVDSFLVNMVDQIAPTVVINNPIVGDSVTLSWTASDNDRISHYMVDYTLDSGQNWIEVSYGPGGDSGSVTMPIPDQIPAISIRVTCFDPAGNFGSDTLDISPTSSNDDNSIPTSFFLGQSYPNPFNPAATISYGLPENAYVTIEVFDVTGARIAVLTDQFQPAGLHNVFWNAGSSPSGTYLYRIMAGPHSAVGRATLIK